MNLRTKIIVMCSLLMLFAIGIITIYTTISQQQTYIERECVKQVQMKDLLTQAIAGQYYSALNLYLTNSINNRQELVNRSKFITNYLETLYRNNPELDIEHILKQFKASYNNSNVDLLVAKNGQTIIKNSIFDLSKARSLNNSSIEELLLRSTVGSAGAFVSFFTPNSVRDIHAKHNIKDDLHDESLTEKGLTEGSLTQKSVKKLQNSGSNQQNGEAEQLKLSSEQKTQSAKQNRYLIYAFNLQLDCEYRIALVHDINYLYEAYQSSEDTILRQLKDTVYSMNVGNTLLGDAFIIDASTHSMLLTTCDKQALAEYGFTNNQVSADLIVPMVQDDESAKKALKAWQIQKIDQALAAFNNQKFTQTSNTYEQLYQTLQLKINQQDYYAAYNYYEPLDWYIVLITKKSDIVAPAYAQAKISLIIGMVVMVVTLVVCLLFSHFLTRRLSDIAYKAQQISQANLSDPSAIQKITSGLHDQGSDEVSQINHALALMGQSLSVNLDNLFKAIRQTTTLESELNTAHQIQQGMLVPPEELVRTPYNEIMAMMSPAKAVGGDFYDAFAIDDDRIAFIIGDVSDKGVPAALFMSMTMHLAKSYLLMNYSPADSCAFINNRLSERNPNMMFVTMCVGILNVKTGEYIICNAGHCLPVVLEDGTVTQLEQLCGPAVGPLPDIPYIEYSGNLKIGSSIFLYTDGVTEAQNEQQQFFEVDRLLDILSVHGSDSPQQVVETVYNKILEFRANANQSDDITMLCVKRIELKS